MSTGLRIVFAGTSDFGIPTLNVVRRSSHTLCAVYTQPDRPAGRGRHVTAGPIKQWALAHGIALRQPEHLKDPAEHAWLKQAAPDLIIVAAYGLLLPAVVLAIPALGCLNLHASLLPRWRGAAPIQHAILAGDSTTGISFMRMEAGLDTGPVWSRVACAIGDRCTTKDLQARLAELGAEALPAVLQDVRDGKLLPVAQDPRHMTYAHKITKQQARLDWQQTAHQLERQVRAFNPWPVATTTFEDNDLRVWEAQVHAVPSTMAPGTVVQANSAGIDVATGAGLLRLLSVQVAGQRRVTAADFVNGRPWLRDGTRILRLGNPA